MNTVMTSTCIKVQLTNDTWTDDLCNWIKPSSSSSWSLVARYNCLIIISHYCSLTYWHFLIKVVNQGQQGTILQNNFLSKQWLLVAKWHLKASWYCFCCCFLLVDNCKIIRNHPESLAEVYLTSFNQTITLSSRSLLLTIKCPCIDYVRISKNHDSVSMSANPSQTMPGYY